MKKNSFDNYAIDLSFYWCNLIQLDYASTSALLLLPPRLTCGRGVGGLHLGVGVGPEPAEDVGGLQVGALVAAREVAQATRRPHVRQVA